MHVRPTDVSTVCVRCVCVDPLFFPAVPACGTMRLCGHQDHRQHRHRHHIAPVYVCLYWRAALQGKEEIRSKNSKAVFFTNKINDFIVVFLKMKTGKVLLVHRQL